MQCKARETQFGYSKQGASNAAMRPILLFPEDSRPMGNLPRCQACQGDDHWLRPPPCIHPHRARNASCRMMVNRLSC